MFYFVNKSYGIFSFFSLSSNCIMQSITYFHVGDLGLFMMAQLSVLKIYVGIYTILLLMGLGYSLFLMRAHRYVTLLSLGLAPLLAVSVIMIVSVWFLTFNFSLHAFQITMYMMMAMSLLLTIYFYYRRRWLFHFALSWLAITGFLLFLCAALLIAILWNNYVNDFFYYRLGVDVAAYAASANWLLHGGNLASVTNEPNHYYIREILIYALRWGLPYLTAFLTSVYPGNQLTVYMTLQPIVFLIFACGAWTMAWLTTTSKFFAWASDTKKMCAMSVVALCIVANASLIYYLGEGFYPQIVAVTFFNLIWVLLFFESVNAGATFILVLLFSATFLPLYSEFYNFLLLSLGAILLLKIYKKDMTDIRRDFLFLGAVIFAFLLVAPLAIKIIQFTINNSVNVGHVGYIQPAWALPADLAGLTNMFSQMNDYLDEVRSTHLLENGRSFLAYVLSLWVLWELFYLARTQSRLRHRMLVLFLVCVAIFVVNCLLNFFTHYYPKNYLYDKLVISFAPIVTVLFLVAVLARPDENKKIFFKKLAKIGLVVLLVFTSMFSLARDKNNFIGAIDMTSIKQIAAWPPLNQYEWLANERGYRQGEVNKKYRFTDRTSEFMMSAMLQQYMVDQWSPKEWLRLSPTKEIILIVRKTALINTAATLQQYHAEILFDTPTYVVIRTHKTVAEMLVGDENKNKENVQALFVR